MPNRFSVESPESVGERRDEEEREGMAWIQRGGLGVNLLTGLGVLIVLAIVVSVLIRVIG